MSAIFVVWAVVVSFQRRSSRRHLLVIVLSYMSTITVFACIYLHQSFWGDLRDATSQYAYYHDQYEARKQNPQFKVHPRKYGARVFSGIEEKSWRSVEDVDPEIVGECKPHPECAWTYSAGGPQEHFVEFQDSAIVSIFLDCLHLSIITMATVGYGNIAPIKWYAKATTNIRLLCRICGSRLAADSFLDRDKTNFFINLVVDPFFIANTNSNPAECGQPVD